MVNKNELKEYVGFSIGKIDMMMKNNEISYSKVGKNVRFDKNKQKGITTFRMTKDIKFTMDKREVDGYYTYPFGYKGIKHN